VDEVRPSDSPKPQPYACAYLEHSTLETAHAGFNGDKDPIPAGTYDAFIRTEHDPNRVELKGLAGSGHTEIQIHNGNTVDDVKGCFAAGETRTTDKVNKSIAAMNEVLKIIEKDNTGIITVKVIGSPTPPPENKLPDPPVPQL
jgi:hypothetical protein